MIRMPSKSFSGPLPALSPPQEAFSAELRQHVEKLAGEIGERNVYLPKKLTAAADYIESTLSAAGHTVARQSYPAGGESCDNLEVEVLGSVWPDEIVVIGAHYDSVVGSPGADDNASGVAALLALAHRPELQKPGRTLRFVAFVNEEPPFFQTEQMGSLVYARRCRERGERIVAMLSLESLGYYQAAEGSQKYPFPIGVFYPSRGDFVAFVGRTKDRALVRRCVKQFREQAQFPSEGGALPGALPGIGWSDHWAFWQVDYPAVMATDTAPFRSRHYHTDNDTPDKLDYDRFARVIDGLASVIEDLVAR
ncbi:MAG: M28 family peptidase [Verrucomicrobiae bacterium]|nr:M28 family peptidase [Verrucomicrobiae bacterium]